MSNSSLRRSPTLTPRSFWLGVAVITAALLFHALFPRYEFHTYTRVDRWTGQVSPYPGR